MRNKYNKDFENFVKENVSKYTKEDFKALLEDKYNINIFYDVLRRYFNRYNIKYKWTNYKKNNKRNVLKCPIGTERITNEGVFVKIAHPDKWRRKSRVMYEKYHNCKLKDNEYIIFLNKNNNDFNKENLIKDTKTEIAYLHNKEMLSINPKITNLGLITAKLMIKTKELMENTKIITKSKKK
jgi:hypothetical protein